MSRIKRLNADGVITITSGAVALGVHVVGVGDILADDSDATYVEGDPSPYAVNAQLFELSSYDPGDPVNLHIRLSLESDDHSGTSSRLYIFLQDGHPDDDGGSYYVGQFTTASWNVPAAFPPPFDGTIKDLVLPLRVRPGKTLTDCMTVLESGTAQLALNTLTILDADFTMSNVRVYEAWLEVGVAPTITVAPPCHLYPRDDDQGVGGGAIWPPPSSGRPGSYY